MKTFYKKLSALIILSALSVGCLFSQDVSFTTDTTEGCTPLNVLVTNTSTIDTNGVTFIWNFGEGDDWYGYDTSHTYNSPGNYGIWVQAFDSLFNYIGYYDTQINVFGFSDTIIMSTGPTACFGEEINFYTNDQYYWVEWDFGDGGTAYWNYYPHTYSDSGIYVVTMVIENQCGIDTTVQSIEITNSSIPIVGINVIGGNNFCLGDEIMFMNNYYAETYFWDFGDGNTSTDESPVYHAYSTIGSKTATLTVTNICGNQKTDTAYITIASTGVPAYAGFNFWPQPACPNTAVEFFVWYSGDYLWDFGDGGMSNLRDPQHFYADTGIYNVQLIVTNSCGDADTAYQDIYIQYNPSYKPDAQIRFKDINDSQIDTITICPGTEVNFENETWGGSGTYLTYLWDFGDGTPTETDKDVSHIFNLEGTFQVMMIVTNNCMGSDTASKWVIVDANAMPNSQLFIAPDTICPGERVYFVDEGGNDNNLETYIYSIWFGDGDSLVNFTEPTDTLVECLASHTYPDTAGIFSFIITVTNLCGNTDSLTGNIVVDTISANNPFYYVGNSTESQEGPAPEFPEWDTPFDANDHVFIIPLQWPEWEPGMNETFYIIFWGEMIEPGIMPDGIVVQYGLDTAIAYIPDSLGLDSVWIAAVWWCFGTIGEEPDAMGMLSQNYPVIAGDTTEVPPVIIGNWDGTCKNDNTGCPGDTVQFMVAGGTSYEWHFGDGATDTMQISYHAYADTGIYDAYVIATNSCGRIDTIYTGVTISNTNIPNAGFDTDIDQNWACANDTINFYYNDWDDIDNNTYYWDFDDGDTSNLKNPSHVYTSPGEYTVTLTVTNACGSNSNEQTINIGMPDVYFYTSDTIVLISTPVDFFNLTNGAISYLWDFGDGSNSTEQSPVYSYPAPGVYIITLTATSPYGCSGIFTQDITVLDIPEIVQAAIQDISCFGVCNGSIDITVTGGLPPYAYNWSNGDTIQDIDGLCANTYSVTITDNNAVSISQAYTVTQPDELILNIIADSVTCPGYNNGSADLTVTGGTTPYVYNWSNGAVTEDISDLLAGIYIVAVIDSNGCTTTDSVNITQPEPLVITTYTIDANCGSSDGQAWVNITGGPGGGFQYEWNTVPLQFTDTAFNLSAGTYSVQIKDVYNCLDTATVIINNIAGPIAAAYPAAYPSCYGGNDGQAIVYVISGTPPYSYEWNTVPPQTDSIATGLEAGIYTVTVTDIVDCIAIDTVLINNPEELIVSITANNPLCNGSYDGNATAIATGGADWWYQYSWSNGCIADYNVNIQAGTYTVTVSDGNSCTATESITLTNPDEIIITSFVSDVTIQGGSDGVIDITVTGGIPPYAYDWSNTATTQDINDLSAGTYTVTVTDNNGCFIIESITVEDPNPIYISLGNDTTFCDGDSIILDAGAGFLTYDWSTGETTQSITVYLPGTYSVTVTDAVSSGSDAITINVVYPYDEQICIVTVDSITGKNLIVWEKTPAVGTVSYNIYRETTTAGVYDSIGNVPFDSLSIFIDYTSNPIVKADRYKISTIDICGNESQLSLHHRTLHLSTSPGAPTGFELNWVDSYEGFTFFTYYIYRGTSPGNFQLIDSIQNTNFSYTDTTTLTGTLYYMVAAVKPDACYPTVTAKTQSGPYSQSLSNIDEGLAVGITEITDNNGELNIYPNPFNNKTTIEFYNPEGERYKLIVTDITGKTVKVIENINTGKVEVEKGNLSEGFYLIELRGGKIYRGRLIVE